MKNKITILLGAVLFTTGAYSQNTSGEVSGGTKAALNVSSNRETMINGIPYSQYKAQQDALKQQTAMKKNTVTANNNINDPSSPNSPAVMQAPIVVTKPVAVVVKPADITSAKQEKTLTPEPVKSPDIAMTSSNKTVAPATVVKVADVSAHQPSIDNSASSENFKPGETKPVIIVPVKEKPVVTQPVTTPLNLNSTSVRGVTEVPVVEKPVKKD